MIIAERKPFEEIKGYVKNNERILILGCETCVAVCQAGGRKEVEILGSQLRLAFGNGGKKIGVYEEAAIRQCDDEYMDDPTLIEKVRDADVVVSMACG
ncbi:MAG: hypothetical protein JXA79_07065, partial [Deltaproteobacteria bacterium]|nr:hypothetical protein [Deltaproteobacteria bacterium]